MLTLHDTVLQFQMYVYIIYLASLGTWRGRERKVKFGVFSFQK